jgi:hypothetical protein
VAQGVFVPRAPSTARTPNFQSVPVLSAINLQLGKLSVMILDERSVAIVNLP